MTCARTGTALLLAVVLAGAALGCEQPDSDGMARVRIYDQPVICNENAGCLSPIQTQVPAEDQTASAFVSRMTSRFGAGGLYLYFELRRTSGAVALVEVDVPTTNKAGAAATAPHYLYREYKDGKKVFDSNSVRGKVEVPTSPTCACQDGRLELEFVDHGPDGVKGTLDDRVRRLSRGYFGLLSSSCRYARLTNIEQQKNRVEVLGISHCPGKAKDTDTTPSSGGGGYYDDHDHYYGCAGYPEEDDSYYDETEETGCGGDDTYEDEEYSGCEGDSWDSGDSSSDSQGCEGDSWDSGSSSDGGCEGDSFDSGSSSGGGCEGDGASAASSCEGDAWAGVGSGKGRRKRPPPQWKQALGMVPPFLFLAVVHVYFRRRGRNNK